LKSLRAQTLFGIERPTGLIPFYNKSAKQEGNSVRSLGGPELLVIGLVIVLLFGGSKLPDLAKGLGEGIKNFKKSVKDEDEKPKSDSTSKDI
jgi:sec-independent protein translocase protein TatA